jgi:hypothetical protein
VKNCPLVVDVLLIDGGLNALPYCPALVWADRCLPSSSTIEGIEVELGEK